MADKAEEKRGTVELTQDQILGIELIMTRKQLAQAQEKLAVHELKKAQRNLMSAVRDEAVLLAKVTQAHGLDKIKVARIVGRTQLEYELE